MASIRCPNCNFLNFATEPACKRCRQPIGNFVPETVSAGYGTTNLRTSTASPAPVISGPPPRRAQPTSYFEPPPPNFFDELRQEHPAAVVSNDNALTASIPPVCAKCGDRDNLSMQKFKKDYTPPLAYLAVFLGPLLCVVVLMLFRKQHKLNGFFCSECWSKFKNHTLISTLQALVFLALFIGGLYVTSIGPTPYPGLSMVGLSFVTTICAMYYCRRISPKFVKMSRKQVYIKIPNYGEVDFTRSAL